MKKITILIASAAVFASGTVMAYGADGSSASVYGGYSSMKLEDGSDSIKPSGYDLGIRTTLGQNVGLFGTVEYTRFKGDDTFSGVKVNVTTDEIRGTVGYSFPVAANAKFYGEAGYESLHLKFNVAGTSDSGTDKGPYIGIGGVADLSPVASVYGRLGYLTLKEKDSSDVSGPDMLAGVAFKIAPQASLFAEGRYAALSQDGTDLNLQSIRAGLKLSFQ